jgi:butyrate kinase
MICAQKSKRQEDGMQREIPVILVINTGSTSTKCALYSIQKEGISLLEDRNFSCTEAKGPPLLSPFDEPAEKARKSKDFRASQVREFVHECLPPKAAIIAVGAIGGMLPPVPAGAIRIDEALAKYCIETPMHHHASNLAAGIAYEYARTLSVPAFIVDPVGVDEMSDVARISGSPLFPRFSFVHALNIRATARRLSKQIGIPFESLRVVACHLGGGFSIAPLVDGRIVDSDNRMESAPFTPERAGGIPPLPLLEACFSGAWKKEELHDQLYGQGGLYAYFGTKDVKLVAALREKGDRLAVLVFDAMIYQICKEIGAMASVLDFDLHGIILTGGVSKEPYLSSQIIRRCSKLAPIFHFPGEDENESIARTVQAVLSGQERAMEWPSCIIPDSKRDPLLSLGWEKPDTRRNSDDKI